jgi:cation diffusion facilitator CzcD-associated flavoprotein CzcO
MNLPVRTGVNVTGISTGPGGKEFEVKAEGGSYQAANVVVASGAMQTPIPLLLARNFLRG